MGCAFDVHNELGGGHQEKYYQRALARALQEKGLGFKEQVYAPLFYKEQVVGKNFFDFLVDDKVVLEIKKGTRYSKKNIDQILGYLKINKLKLAILINFGQNAVTHKRIINFDS